MKIKSKCNRVEIQDLDGVNINSYIEKLLSEELAKEIDKNILRGLGIEPDRNKRMNKINKIFK